MSACRDRCGAEALVWGLGGLPRARLLMKRISRNWGTGLTCSAGKALPPPRAADQSVPRALPLLDAIATVRGRIDALVHLRRTSQPVPAPNLMRGRRALDVVRSGEQQPNWPRAPVEAHVLAPCLPLPDRIPSP